MTVVSFTDPVKAENIVYVSFKPEVATPSEHPQPQAIDAGTATAVVYCEGNFGLIDGKTANGLVRHSQKYTILGVIDSTQAGRDAGEVLDGEPNGIPISASSAMRLQTCSVHPTISSTAWRPRLACCLPANGQSFSARWDSA